MTENTALWDKLGKTDPSHTKTFKRAGGFSGTAIKPMWSYKRMTEEFGPCGVGWGLGEPTFQVVPGENKEVLVYCTAMIWYREDDKNAVVYGVGGDKIVTYIKANEQYNRPERWENDDEAFKKAFTDAVTNALKMIGVGADVHMGMFDDSKYVNTMKKEFAEDHKDPEAKPASAPKNDKARETYTALQNDMRQCKTKDDLGRWWRDEECKALRATLPADWQANLKTQLVELGDTVSAIQDQFPGATVTNDRIANDHGRELHPMEAAE